MSLFQSGRVLGVCVCMSVGVGWPERSPKLLHANISAPPRVPHPPRSSEWAGKGAWVRLSRGAWAKERGFSLKQNNNTGRRGPQFGSSPNGGKIWEKKPILGCGAAKGESKIFGEKDQWEAQSFSELSINSPKFRAG